MHLSKILDNASIKFGDTPCMQYVQPPNGAISFREARTLSVKHRIWIQNILHASAMNDVVVAYLCWNSADMLLSLLGCLSFPKVLPALLNARWTPSEIARALQSSNKNAMTLLIYGPGLDQKARQVVSLVSHTVSALQLPGYAQTMSQFKRVHRDSRNREDKDFLMLNEHDTCGALDEDADALVVFTSGTSGGAKGVRLSHRALHVQAEAKLTSPCSYSCSSRMLGTTVPLFHIGGLSSVLALLLAGGCWMIAPSNGSFDPKLVAQSLSLNRRLSCNTLVVVPTMLHSIFKGLAHGQSFPFVELVLIGGQSATAGTLQRTTTVFPNARVVQTYACTEAASSLTFLDWTSKSGHSIRNRSHPSADCVGKPPSHVELVITENKEVGGNTIQEPFQVGIIATRGRHVMNGYWERGADVQSKPDGWLRTNDLGFLDDQGMLYFCGRAADVIRSGGETVVASEVERVLLLHPRIAECAVFATEDARFGEAVTAAIVGNDNLTVRQVRRFCTANGLAGYKRPRKVFRVKELPRNSSGKMLKHLLRDQFSSGNSLRSRL